MKILVLGASGMAGHLITIYLKEVGHDVTAFTRRVFPWCKNIIGDAKDLELLKSVIEQGDFDAVINAIGILNRDAEDNKSDAVLLNSLLPHYLSKTTENSKTRIIHMSTDCVFSGKKGGYSETSLRDGESFYDRTKALGELENDKDLTFRQSIIGPDINPNGIGLFNWFMQQDTAIQGYSKAIWTGVTTLTLAKAMNQALMSNLSGLYNLVNNETITKFDLLRVFNHHFKNDKLDIKPNTQVEIDKSLVNNRTDFNFVVPSYEVMIKEMEMWMLNHKELYPHYF